MLETYKQLVDKKEKFASHVVVNSRQELDQCLADLESKQNHRKERFLFRGHNEASYKLYTSSQRFWNYRNMATTRMNYTDAIVKMINILKAGPLYDYYKRLGVVQNDWLYLSFLQHYGAPSPLLDFSRKYDVALFFAFDEVKFEGKGIDEKGICVKGPEQLIGKTLVEVSEDFYRPTDVVNLWGDPTKAKAKLGWNPNKTTFKQLVKLMVDHDMGKVAAEGAAAKVRTNLAEYLEKGIVK